MMHNLMKEYGLTREQAGKMREYDYYLMIAFRNLEVKKEKYLYKRND